MMKYLILTLALAALLLGCNNPNAAAGENTSASGAQASSQEGDANTSSPTAVRAELEGEPALGAAKVLIYVLENNNGVSGATVEITGDMTHAGMAPVSATAKEVGAGLYETEGFEFTMAGDWILTADVTYPDGTEAEDTLALSVPGQ